MEDEFGSAEVSRAYRDGLSEKRADRWAVRLGFDPYQVWPHMLDQAIEDLYRECPRCGTRFVPVRRTQIGCSPACARWLRNRRRRARPKAQAAARAQAAAYYQANADRLRAARRERYRKSKSSPGPAAESGPRREGGDGLATGPVAPQIPQPQVEGQPLDEVDPLGAPAAPGLGEVPGAAGSLTVNPRTVRT